MVTTPIKASVSTSEAAEGKAESKSRRLSDRHYKEWVEGRGLDERWVTANVRSVSVDEASNLLGYKAKSSGVWIEGSNFQGQFRPDKPWRSDDKPKAKAPKYRTASGIDYDAILVANPNDANYWSDIEALKERCYHIDGNPCLVITEGGAKAISGCTNNIPTIALLGVEMGLTSKEADPQGKRYLVPTLEKFARAGFGFIFAYDADATTNNFINWAQHKLARQLKKFQVPIYSVTGLWEIEQGKGMDDYIQSNGADKFKQEVLGKTVSIEAWEKQFAIVGEKNSQKNDKPEPNKLASEIAEKYREKLAWNIQVREWFLYERKQKGVWAKSPKEAIEKVVKVELDAAVPDGYNYRFLADVINLLKSELMVEEWDANKNVIPLLNVVLDKKTRKPLAHSPGYRLTYCLPFNYDASATCEVIVDWLKETVGGKEDLVKFLLAYLNAVVNRRADLQRYLELIGPGGTGKSTYMKLASALVGKKNTHTTKHQLLEESRFETANLYGKALTLVTEADQYVGAVNVLKAITGQDELHYEEKMKQAGEGFTYEGMVITAGNEPSRSTDYTSGLARRKIAVWFRNFISPKKRKDLDKEFKRYLPGLLNLILNLTDEQVTHLIREAESVCPSLREYQRETLCETNPIADWVDNKVIRMPEARHSPMFFYNSLKVYCDETGQKPVSLKRFTNLLTDLCQVQLGWSDVTKGRDRTGRYITGLTLRAENDPSPYPITEMLDLSVDEETSAPADPINEDVAVTDEMLSVTDSVTAETTAVYGCDGCDGFLEDNARESDVIGTCQMTDDCANDLEMTDLSVTRHASDMTQESGTVQELLADLWDEPLNQEVEVIEELVETAPVEEKLTVEEEARVLTPLLADESICPDKEELAIFRANFSPEALNLACKSLYPERHSRIKEWVLLLNCQGKSYRYAGNDYSIQKLCKAKPLIVNAINGDVALVSSTQWHQSITQEIPFADLKELE